MTNNTIKHLGIVENIQGSHLSVRIVQTSACAACSVKGHCSSADSKDKIIDIIDTAAASYQVGENVMVVKAGGAAVFHQLPHAGDGAVVDHPAVQILPDLVQGLQPVEQLQILHLRQVTAEGLVQMVMGVDEAGIDDATGGVDDLLRLLFLRADVGDDAVLHQQIAVGVHGVAGVAGDDVGCVFHQ